MRYEGRIAHPTPASDLAAQASRVLDGWVAEHARYYGTPAGFAQAPDGLPAGYHDIPGGGGWLTSAGNWHAVTLAGDGIDVAYDGRRHGMRPEFADLLWAAHRAWVLTDEEYETEEPSWRPWETSASRVPAGVREALHAAGIADIPTRWDAEAQMVYLRRRNEQDPTAAPYALAVSPARVLGAPGDA